MRLARPAVSALLVPALLAILGAAAACSGSKGDTGDTGPAGPAGPQGVPGTSVSTGDGGGAPSDAGGSTDGSTADAGPPVTATLTFTNGEADGLPQTVYALSFGVFDTLGPAQTSPSAPTFAQLSVQVPEDASTSMLEAQGSAGIPFGTATLTIPATASEAPLTVTFANAYLQSYVDTDARIDGTALVTLDFAVLSFSIPTTCTALPGPYAVTHSPDESVASGAIRGTTIAVIGSQPVSDTNSGMGVGKPSLQGITVGLPLESQIGCSAKYLINGNGEQPVSTEIDVASPISAAAGASTATYDLCGPVVTGVTISGTVGSLTETLTLNGGGLVTTTRSFGSDGGVTASTSGWNFNSNAAISACP